MVLAGGPNAQVVELLVCVTTVLKIIAVAYEGKTIKKLAERDGGPIDESKLPNSLIARVSTPLQALSLALPPFIYLGGILSNHLVQPAWFDQWCLPFEMGVDNKAWIRIAACVVNLAASGAIHVVSKHLGKNWHYIGVSRFSHIIISTSGRATVYGLTFVPYRCAKGQV